MWKLAILALQRTGIRRIVGGMESFNELLEKANLRPAFKFGAITMFAGYEALKELASKLGIPMEQITPAQIIHEASEQNAESQRFQDYLSRTSPTPPKGAP